MSAVPSALSSSFQQQGSALRLQEPRISRAVFAPRPRSFRVSSRLNDFYNFLSKALTVGDIPVDSPERMVEVLLSKAKEGEIKKLIIGDHGFPAFNPLTREDCKYVSTAGWAPIAFFPTAETSNPSLSAFARFLRKVLSWNLGAATWERLKLDSNFSSGCRLSGACGYALEITTSASHPALKVAA